MAAAVTAATDTAGTVTVVIGTPTTPISALVPISATTTITMAEVEGILTRVRPFGPWSAAFPTRSRRQLWPMAFTRSKVAKSMLRPGSTKLKLLMAPL